MFAWRPRKLWFTEPLRPITRGFARENLTNNLLYQAETARIAGTSFKFEGSERNNLLYQAETARIEQRSLRAGRFSVLAATKNRRNRPFHKSGGKTK